MGWHSAPFHIGPAIAPTQPYLAELSGVLCCGVEYMLPLCIATMCQLGGLAKWPFSCAKVHVHAKPVSSAFWHD